MSAENNFLFSYSTQAVLNTSAETAFNYLDDPKKLSAHMGKSSVMMAGSKMNMIVDSKGGRELGSVIKMTGNKLGLELFLQEKITEREPSKKKFGKPLDLKIR